MNPSRRPLSTGIWRLKQALQRRSLNRLGPVPVTARHAEWSVISSADDLYVRSPSPLVELLVGAAEIASSIDLEPLRERANREQTIYIDCWPGEHYRLLPALARAFRASMAAEIGTFEGASALALTIGLPPDGRVVTYDIVPWQEMAESVLRAEDFENGLEQRIGDLSDPLYLEDQLPTLRKADVIFVDGPKDGLFEERFVRTALPELTDRPRLIVFDDIRVLNMVQLWRDLPFVKLDATSLGHWSGTGLLLTA